MYAGGESDISGLTAVSVIKKLGDWTPEILRGLSSSRSDRIGSDDSEHERHRSGSFPGRFVFIFTKSSMIVLNHETCYIFVIIGPVLLFAITRETRTRGDSENGSPFEFHGSLAHLGIDHARRESSSRFTSLGRLGEKD